RMSNWMLLRDYNCDGKQDLFAHTPGGIMVYRNDSDVNGLAFTMVDARVQTERANGPANLLVTSVDFPAIEDIDNDGDLDVLTFDGGGTLVEFHRNRSMEDFGNCDSLHFELAETCWGKFAEDGSNSSITLGVSCKGGSGNQTEGGGAHAGSTIIALDMDDDGDKEVILGDISSANLVLLTNGGDSLNANMVAVEEEFPSNTQSVQINTFPIGFHLDVNNDGFKDFLAVPNNENISENFTSVWYYRNTATDGQVVLDLAQLNFLQDEMLEFGAGANPVFFDENGDGLLDLLVGNDSYHDGGANTSSLTLLRNTGTANAPAFDLITRDYANASTLDVRGLYPSVGDLDGDGDEDLILGDWNGNLHYFQNTAGAGSAANFALAEAVFKGIDVGQYAAPQIVDINQDGLPDLLVGERSGNLNYFRNIGTAAAPDFTTDPTLGQFGGIDVFVPCCTGYSSPFMVKDSTGNYDLYVGSEQGYIYFYNNIGNDLTGNFAVTDSFYTGTFRISLAGAFLDADGQFDFVVGEYPGGLVFYHTNSDLETSVREIDRAQRAPLKAYPNPANQRLLLEFPEHLAGQSVTVEVVSVTGQLVYRAQDAAAGLRTLSTASWPDGIYLLRANSSAGWQAHQKLIIAH
ncbi:MAG: FG-GAP-like repeat-containing protein, partial [Bacteroidota bacterium]